MGNVIILKHTLSYHGSENILIQSIKPHLWHQLKMIIKRACIQQVPNMTSVKICLCPTVRSNIYGFRFPGLNTLPGLAANTNCRTQATTRKRSRAVKPVPRHYRAIGRQQLQLFWAQQGVNSDLGLPAGARPPSAEAAARSCHGDPERGERARRGSRARPRAGSRRGWPFPGEQRTPASELLKPPPAPSHGLQAALPASGGLGSDTRAVRGNRTPRPLPSDRPPPSHHFWPLRAAGPAEPQPPPCAEGLPASRPGLGLGPAGPAGDEARALVPLPRPAEGPLGTPGASPCQAVALRPRLTWCSFSTWLRQGYRSEIHR